MNDLNTLPPKTMAVLPSSVNPPSSVSVPEVVGNTVYRQQRTTRSGRGASKSQQNTPGLLYHLRCLPVAAETPANQLTEIMKLPEVGFRDETKLKNNPGAFEPTTLIEVRSVIPSTEGSTSLSCYERTQPLQAAEPPGSCTGLSPSPGSGSLPGTIEQQLIVLAVRKRVYVSVLTPSG